MNTITTIMTHTKAHLTLDLTRAEIYEIAKDLRKKKKLTEGISQYKKEQLIDFILNHQSEEPQTKIMLIEEYKPESIEAEEIIEFTSVPTPEEFFNLVKGLDSKLKVTQACNALNDALSEKYQTAASVSWAMSGYKKLFYGYQHSNPKLNERVKIKGELKTQHIAARLIALNEEQITDLNNSRKVNEASRLGIDENGDIREVELPPQNIKSIIEKACELLLSTNPVDIACGLLPLTGLRRNEQNMPAIEYDNGVIVREWKVIGEFLIAIKGLSKKGGNDNWFARATLAPAQMIVDAQKRFLASPKVKAIPSNYEAYNNGGFRKAVDRKFKEIWETEFSTIEAYDDNGKKISNNASTHKARAFYTWALVPILKANGMKQKQAKKYIKECLGHDDEKDTSKYFNRYDEDQFIEAVDINIPTNFKAVGCMETEKVEQMIQELIESGETPEEAIEQALAKDTPKVENSRIESREFDLTKFIEAIPENLQIKFTELLQKEVDITDALIEIVNAAKNIKNQIEKVPPVAEKITLILTAIMEYNQQQAEIKNIVIPTYAFCNGVSKRAFGKEIARNTYDNCWNTHGQDIIERLGNRQIPNIPRNEAKMQGVISQEMHNGKYHRRDKNEVIQKVVDILELM